MAVRDCPQRPDRKAPHGSCWQRSRVSIHAASRSPRTGRAIARQDVEPQPERAGGKGQARDEQHEHEAQRSDAVNHGDAPSLKRAG